MSGDFDPYDPRRWGVLLYRCLNMNIAPIAAAPIARGIARELPTLLIAPPASCATVPIVVLASCDTVPTRLTPRSMMYLPAPATLSIAVPAAWYMPTAAWLMLWPMLLKNEPNVID